MEGKLGLPVLIGEKVLWAKNSTNAEKNFETGIIKWIGNIAEIDATWSVGLETDSPLQDETCDGVWRGRKLFDCQKGRGIIVPIHQIRKLPPNTDSDESRKDHKLSFFQTEDSNDCDYKYWELETRRGHFPPQKSDFHAIDYQCDFDGVKEKNKGSIGNDKSIILRPRQSNILKSKAGDGKLSLKNRGKKRNSTGHYSDRNSLRSRKSDDHLRLVRLSLGSYFSNERFNRSSQNSSNMNDVAGYFKKIKEEDEADDKSRKPVDECERQLGELLAIDIQDSPLARHKEKKFFSFLKWFKKNKENENFPRFGASSVTSSPVLEKRRNSSCESFDTIFSTQTVRSFAYIPPAGYVPSAQPSAPPSNLLDFSGTTLPRDEDPSSLKNDARENSSDSSASTSGFRVARQNSLPSTLERKNPKESGNRESTLPRRRSSESSTDRRPYCHVQGKRKAPLPPSNASLYPNLQKLNTNYQSLKKKKKPAPPPPTSKQPTMKSDSEAHTDKNRIEAKESPKTHEASLEGTVNMIKQAESPSDSSVDTSLSPLPSRPWYKRNHKDSGGKQFLKKDLLKGFEWKRNKETDNWMPEIGFPRRSLLADNSHGKFLIFPKMEKTTEDKRKEEKRKSQISILTNISELDREAAEIVRKEMAEERKMKAKNDARYYSTNLPQEIAFPKAEEKKIKIISNDPNKNFQTNSNSSHKSPSENSKPNANENRYQIKSKPAENNSEVSAERSTYFGRTSSLIDDVTSQPKPLPDANETKKTGKEVETIPISENGDVKSTELRYLNEPWVCGKCTLENACWRVFCEICGSVKPHFLHNFNDKKTKAESGPTDAIALEEKIEVAKNEQTTEVKEIKRDDPSEPNKQYNDSNLDEEKTKRLNDGKNHLEESPKGDNKTRSETKQSHESDDNNKAKLKIDTSEKTKSADDQNKEFTSNDTKAPSFENVPEKKKEIAEHPQLSATSASNITTDRAVCGPTKKSASCPSSQKVVEAYVITHTTVLEDIIIRKADENIRGKKKEEESKESKNRAQSKIEKPKTSRQVAPLREIPLKKSPPTPIDLSADELDVEEDVEELTNMLTRAEGLADFKANIREMPANAAVNTVAANKLLKRLEAAINGGDQAVAAKLAKELALLKVNCSVTRQTGEPAANPSKITIDMYVEDKESHQGPIQIRVTPSMTLLQLKKKVEQELNIPMNIQRWILGKKLATDDHKTLESDGVKNDSCSVFLYLTTPANGESNGGPLRKVKGEHNGVSNPSEEKPKKTSANTQTDPESEDRIIRNHQKKNFSRSTSENPEPTSAIFQKKEDNSERPPKSAKDEKNETLSGGFSDAVKSSGKLEIDSSDIHQINNQNGDNDIEKELKLIKKNSVRQKVEILNKTFEENNRKGNVGPSSSGIWKCVACGQVNTPGRYSCLACSAKKPSRWNKPEAPRIPKKSFSGNEAKPTPTENNEKATPKNSNNFHYDELVKLQDEDVVPNLEPFNCPICLTNYLPGEGITLKDCLHTFCRFCLINTVQYSEDADVKCPYMDNTYSCKSVLQQREIKALVPQKIFDQHLAKSVKEAENKMGNAFHCKTPDCKGWCIYEDNVNEFHCPVCDSINCLTCRAIHSGINCKEFQQRMDDMSDTDGDASKTRQMLDEMVLKGEAMACPKCQVVLMKKWGCDWLRCSMCKTEICWVTRGFRWGPGGKGDTTGGCKCGVNGIKCHPKCNYCH